MNERDRKIRLAADIDPKRIPQDTNTFMSWWSQHVSPPRELTAAELADERKRLEYAEQRAVYHHMQSLKTRWERQLNGDRL